MAEWPITLHIETGDQPMFRRLANAITIDIRRQRLRLGQRLPSTRTLASQLGVSRNTVVAAYEVLRLESWISMEPARGTFVLPRQPDRICDDGQLYPDVAGFDIESLGLAPDMPVTRAKETIIMLGGVPDLRLLPQTEFARTYRNVLRGREGKRLLDYADPQGNHRLRGAIADLLSRRRGCTAGPNSIFTVRGSQQGMYLAARTLIAPGDVVAVEAYGYCNAWKALRLAGAVLHPIPVDENGIDVSELEKLCESQQVRAALVTPHHQYPTGVALSKARRKALLTLARDHRMILFEDDYDHEFHYDNQPILPLLSEDNFGVVVYFGTMSKTLAPGIRVGYVVAPLAAIRHMVAYRNYVDVQRNGPGWLDNNLRFISGFPS